MFRRNGRVGDKLMDLLDLLVAEGDGIEPVGMATLRQSTRVETLQVEKTSTSWNTKSDDNFI